MIKKILSKSIVGMATGGLGYFLAAHAPEIFWGAIAGLAIVWALRQ